MRLITELIYAPAKKEPFGDERFLFLCKDVRNYVGGIRDFVAGESELFSIFEYGCSIFITHIFLPSYQGIYTPADYRKLYCRTQPAKAVKGRLSPLFKP